YTTLLRSAVAGIGVDEVMRQHGVEQRPVYHDTVPREQQDIIFDILSDFLDGRVFQSGFETGQHLQTALFIAWCGYIPGLAGLDGKRETYQVGCVGVGPGCFSVETEAALFG